MRGTRFREGRGLPLQFHPRAPGTGAPDGGRPRAAPGLRAGPLARAGPRAAHLAAAALLAAGLLAAPHQALAQDTLVSNTGQSDSGSRTVGYNSTFKFSAAQAFTTGGNTDGYTLTEVKAEIDSTDDENPLVSIYTASGGEPDTSLFTLSNPPSVSANSLNTFSVTGTQTLSANTTYFVVFQQAGASGVYRIETTGSNNQDSGAASGWSIGDDVLWKNQDANDWSTHTRSLQIQIVGSAVTATNTAPTAANNTVTTNEDTNHVFAATEFNFSDDDASDTLASVKITTLELAGRLKLGDDDVILNQIVTKTQIDEGKLKFVPDADANGSSYATFGFTVNDGEADSTSAYTMTIDVTAVNDPPTALNGSIQTSQDTAYTFDSTLFDFGFPDVDGDALAGVRIVSPPAKGSLELDGTGVAPNQLISKSDIDMGKLVFNPASGESGAPYTTFQFKVNDGTVDSEDAYTMTVNVIPDNATGKPAISGPPQVGKALTAGIGDIADGDGLPSTVFPAGYTFQWVEVDGGTETDISGATSQTYTPAAGLVTKAIKVRVGFTDGGGNAESLTSDATWAVMPAASSNCLDNGTVWCGTLTVGQRDDDMTWAGFEDAAGFDIGSVSPATFALDGIDHSVNELLVGGINTLFLSTTPDLPSHGAGLSIHVQTISGELDSPLAGSRTPGTGSDWQLFGVLYNDDTTAVSDVPLLRRSDIASRFPNATPIGTEVAVRLSYDAARDPRLSDLEVENAADDEDIALTPSTFDSATTTYSASVANDVSQVTIKPTANGSGATFEYLDHAGTEIDDADGAKDDWQVPLPVGVNRIRVKVTAETGGATETYMLVLTRAAPNATTALVSNTGQSRTLSGLVIGSTGTGIRTQTFTTGSNSAGYHLTSVGVRVDREDFEAGETLNAWIYTVKSNGHRNALLYTLRIPDSFADDAVNVFEAPPGATLEADTDYMVWLEGTGNSSDDFVLNQTDSDAEDAGKAAGWSIEDAFREGNTLSVDGRSLLIAVNGSAIPVANTAPTAADKTVTTAEDTAYTFEADDFGFEDDDAGDTLASVKITVLATDGELRLDGTAVQANDVISKSDIDGDKLTFVPDVNENGASYATFKFRVNDGTVDSAAEYTMTVDVTAVDDAPADALVSNLDQADDTDVDLSVNPAQQFTTGSNASGYTLTGVDIRVEARHANTFSMSVCSVDASGYPTSTCTALTAPGDFTVRDLRFTAPANTVLAADTMYAVVLDIVTSAVLDATTSDGEDTGSAAGWSLADAYFSNSGGTWSTSAGGKELRIAVRGAARSATNTDASGAPAITGTPQAGQALTAAIGTIADVDGLPTTFPDDYTFQWVRVDGSDETDISGATSGAYTLTDEDVGKTVKVEVSFTDDGGNSEGPLASAETAAVLAAAEDCTTDRAGADWCTTLTVGTRNQNPFVLYGYDGEGSNQFGALGDATIEYGGTSFAVEELRLNVNSVFPSNSEVQVELDAFLSRDTVFDLGGHEFTADASSEQSAVGGYRWALPTGMSWIVGQKVTVSATLGNFPPTASDNTVTTAEDTEYTFTAADFGFEDLDGDDLASVTVTALEDEGDLELDDVDVTEDQEVTKADIDGGKLTFTPASQWH